MIDLSVFPGVAGIDLGELADKPTTLTHGQKEAAVSLWASPEGMVDIGVWDARLAASLPIAHSRSEQAANWVGYILGRVLGMDVGEGRAAADRDHAQNEARVRVRALLRDWLNTGALRAEEQHDGRTGRMRWIVVMGAEPDPEWGNDPEDATITSFFE